MSKKKETRGRPPERIIPHISPKPEKLAALVARDKHSPPIKKPK
jgi:hypothetical protein